MRSRSEDKGARVRGPGSRGGKAFKVQGFKGSRVQGFKGSRVQDNGRNSKFKDQML
jgi:hypothetical protein